MCEDPEMVDIVELDKVRNLDAFLKKLAERGFQVEASAHVVLEDHSELSLYKVYKNSTLVAYVVAHYITQYYKAVLSEAESDSEFLKKLLEIKHSGERWSAPVNPVYLLTYTSDLSEVISSYEDDYPTREAAELVEVYRSRNPNYRLIPRVVVARLKEG
ncbi:MAG: hypothetical protein ACP5KA_04455 [Desulfurococcaceae archaeon]